MLRLFCLLIVLTPSLSLAQGQTREQKVRSDRDRVTAEGFWIYNDLERGFAQARLTGRPLLVVLRCIPCEECVKLDDHLIEQDPELKSLLNQFVCVRRVATNGLDLSLFQFDTDQSFAVFMFNGDGTIYGRYGTRSHRTEWERDVSIAGLAKALEGALELHRQYPENQQTLAGKRGGPFLFPQPEQAPSLRDKFTSALNYEGNVVQSCIHCHQIGDAQRQFYRSRGEPIPDNVIFPYPHPKSIGLIIDPHTRANVLEVTPGSWAAKAGFLPDDQIRTMAGQPLLSIADIQWVLQAVPASGGTVTAEVDRNGKPQQLTLSLPENWRQAGDISWRSSTWGLRRMATGGLLLEVATPEERQAAHIPDGKMALRVKHVGQYGAHATAKKAGFQTGDIVIRFDGKSDFQREADLLRHAVTQHKPGETVTVAVLRQGKELELTLPMQE